MCPFEIRSSGRDCSEGKALSSSGIALSEEFSDESAHFPGRAGVELFAKRHELGPFLQVEPDNELAVFLVLAWLLLGHVARRFEKRRGV